MSNWNRQVDGMHHQMLTSALWTFSEFYYHQMFFWCVVVTMTVCLLPRGTEVSQRGQQSQSLQVTTPTGTGRNLGTGVEPWKVAQANPI